MKCPKCEGKGYTVVNEIEEDDWCSAYRKEKNK